MRKETILPERLPPLLDMLRTWALALPATEEGMPFGNDTLVMKVGTKMFLLTSLDEGTSFNAKADPELSIRLREEFDSAIKLGWHMNKAHWNTITPNGSLTLAQLEWLVRHSYDLVAASLPGYRKVELGIPAPQGPWPW